MPRMGQIFKEAREKKGVTLSQAAIATRMKVQTVQHLENNDFGKIAAPAYAKGFIRLYAEYLGLDSAPLILEYQQQYGSALPVLAPDTKQPAWKKTAKSLGLKLAAGLKKVPRAVWLKLLGAAVVLILIWHLAAWIRTAAEQRGEIPAGAEEESAGMAATPGFLEDPPEPYWDALDPSAKPVQDGDAQ
ncbi:MAG: helix-turn-helix domain-containing protein [Kiritimatiellia bacterium]